MRAARRIFQSGSRKPGRSSWAPSPSARPPALSAAKSNNAAARSGRPAPPLTNPVGTQGSRTAGAGGKESRNRMKRIIVLGGGTGGTLVANLLAKKLKPGEAEILVVSASSRHLYQPGWLYVPFGRQDPLALSRPLKSLLHDHVKLRIGQVTGLDTAQQTVTLEGGANLPYDYLIIATGSHLAPEDVPGLAEGGQHFYSEEAAMRLHAALEEFQGGRIVVGVGGLPYKCPVAPLEFTFLLEEYLTRHHLRAKTELVYTFPIGRVFTIETVAEVAQRMLEERGVQIETFFNLEEVLPAQKMVRSLEGTELPYDLLVMVPPHRGAAFLQGHPIADATGWVRTN